MKLLLVTLFCGSLLVNAQEQFGNYITNVQCQMVMCNQHIVSTITNDNTVYTFTNIVKRPEVKIGFAVTRWDGTNLMVRKVSIELLKSNDLINWQHECNITPTLVYLPTTVNESIIWWHPYLNFDWKTEDFKFFKAVLLDVEYGTMEIGAYHWP